MAVSMRRSTTIHILAALAVGLAFRLWIVSAFPYEAGDTPLYEALAKSLDAHGTYGLEIEGRLLPVPVHLRDAHYRGAKRLGHGEGYQYAHDEPGAVASQDYLGVDRQYYRPTNRGFEQELSERLEVIRKRLRQARTSDAPAPE